MYLILLDICKIVSIVDVSYMCCLAIVCVNYIHTKYFRNEMVSIIYYINLHACVCVCEFIWYCDSVTTESVDRLILHTHTHIHKKEYVRMHVSVWIGESKEPTRAFTELIRSTSNFNKVTHTNMAHTFISIVHTIPPTHMQKLCGALHCKNHHYSFHHHHKHTTITTTTIKGNRQQSSQH